jgi:hypothetical protein
LDCSEERWIGTLVAIKFTTAWGLTKPMWLLSPSKHDDVKLTAILIMVVLVKVAIALWRLAQLTYNSSAKTGLLHIHTLQHQQTETRAYMYATAT